VRGRSLALLIVLAVDLGVFACGRSDVLYKDDAFGPGRGTGGVGGTVGTGGSVHVTGGTGGSRSAGGTTGGGVSTGGSVSAGGSVSTGGGFTGGSGGVGVGGVGVGGVGGSVGGVAGSLPSAGRSGGPYGCVGVAPTCNEFTSFSLTDGATWGTGNFTGGVTAFGPSVTRVMDTSAVHITGTVLDYGTGIIIWFANCSNLKGYSGIEFTVSGSTGYGSFIYFMPLTNSDYAWQPRPQDLRGACTSSTPETPYADCVEPQVSISLGASPVIVPWQAVHGGAPVVWNDVASPTEIVGLQWLLPYDPTYGAYDFDVTLDNVSLYAGGVDCGPGSFGGMGGMAGASGGGNSGAGAGFGGAGFGGTGAGFGGAGLGGSGFGGSGFGGAGFGGAFGGAGAGAFGGEGGLPGNDGGAPQAGGAGI
jgi:hypothetical protein